MASTLPYSPGHHEKGNTFSTYLLQALRYAEFLMHILKIPNQLT